ncbi:hypothetical protein [Aeromicrobium fastidiosum]|uniref:hypothetical protein n=1 Tax=Aeromicrobium fastidiosum TaxID=52699 RepID=UPI001AE52B7A|nr:hypothetical protein [Aeromicrobium fastidiosum]MBP2389692.1 hypothetical protein [Aeromicrobium fastidiosum]
MNYTAATYLAYLLTAVPITVWVATTLSRNGRVFLSDVFHGEDGLADAVNRLLVVGFYLINLGFVMLYLRGGSDVDDLTGLIEALSVKIGVVMLVLGAIHFVNVMVFSSMRRKGLADADRARQAADWARRQEWNQQVAQPQR